MEIETGEIVGYARWIIPKDSGIEWFDAQVSEPTVEKVQEYKERWKGATVDGRSKGSPAIVAELSRRLEKEEESIIKDGSYLSRPLRYPELFEI